MMDLSTMILLAIPAYLFFLMALHMPTKVLQFMGGLEANAKSERYVRGIAFACTAIISIGLLIKMQLV